MKLHSIYFGVVIWRKTTPGYQLPWTAGRLAADTLAGIKQLIKEELKNPHSRPICQP